MLSIFWSNNNLKYIVYRMNWFKIAYRSIIPLRCLRKGITCMLVSWKVGRKPTKGIKGRRHTCYWNIWNVSMVTFYLIDELFHTRLIHGNFVINLKELRFATFFLSSSIQIIILNYTMSIKCLNCSHNFSRNCFNIQRYVLTI